MRTSRYSIVLLLAIVASVCWGAGRPNLSNTAKNTVRLYNKFGVKLYRELSKHENNVFISPVSVSAVLGMIYLGSKGRTAQEIENLLDIKKNSLDSKSVHIGFMEIVQSLKAAVKDFELEIANGVFVSDGILVYKHFEEDIVKFYNSGLYSAVFRDSPEEAMKDLNAWVQDSTNNKIEKLLDRPLPQSIPMVFLNAVYFKGNWLTTFDVKDTKPGKFYGLTRVSDVNMMYQEGDFYHIETDQYQAVEIPYKTEEVIMTVVLPKDPKGIHKLEQNFDFSELRKMLSSVIKQKVKLTLPKFSLSETYDMRGALQNLGVNSAFDTRAADLSGMARKQTNLHVDSVIHRALIDVSENGTVASAVTAGLTSHSLTSNEVAIFTADRPFMVVIEDIKTELILFVGRVADIDKK